MSDDGIVPGLGDVLGDVLGHMSLWPSVMPWPHACLCSDASHTTGKWLPLYVCHLQDIRDILDLLGHIMDPWIQCLHLRSWDDVSEYSSYWVASIPYYARTRRSLATIGYTPYAYSYSPWAYLHTT